MVQVRRAPKLLFAALVASVSASCTGSIGGLADEGGETPAIGGVPIDLSETGHLFRLSGAQWLNAARDALGGDAALVAGISLMASSATFDTFSESSVVGSAEVEQLARAADLVAQRATVDATRVQKLTGGSADRAGAARLLETVGARAFRRPISSDEAASFLAVYDAALAQPEPSVEPALFALRQMLSAMLQSPDFVYRSEFGQGDSKVVRLTPRELVTKWAFAVWNSGPSDALLSEADSGKLATAAGAEAVVETMLQDPRAADVLQRFHGLMLGLDKIRAVERDTARFPKAYAGMGKDMAEELMRFARYVAVDEGDGGGWKAMLTSRVAFVNKPLAALYDVPEAELGALSEAAPWGKVLLPAGRRAGLPTRAGILSFLSNGVNPSSVRRGEFMVKHITCVSVPPPSKQIILAFDQGSETTNRKRVEAKTQACGAGCHGNGRDVPGAMGPLGFAFENYDAAGGWRDKDGDEMVDAASTLAPFGAFSGGVPLLSAVAETELSHSCYAGQWAEYLLGRRTAKGESAAVDAVGKASVSGATVRQIVKALVTSDLFSMRKNAA